MPVNLASPGIVVREVDLTIGRVDSATDKNAAIVGPFEKGPVNIPIIIESEQDLIDNFGKPYNTDNQVEYWMVAASYLAYGGVLSVVRAADSNMKNAVGVGTTAGDAVVINSVDDYINKGYDEDTLAGPVVAARNPGTWANGLKVAIIDSFADQVLTVDSTSGIATGVGIAQTASGILPGAGSTTTLSGTFKGIVTEVGNGFNGYESNQILVKFLSHISGGTETEKDYQASGIYKFGTSQTITIKNNTGGNIGVKTVSAASDWFDSQTITTTNGVPISWNQIADRPGTSAYAAARNSRFDEVHVVVIDDDGDITGNAGTILEKNLNLSKAKDAEFSAGSTSYWRKFLLNASNTIFGLGGPADPVTTAFKSTGSGYVLETDVAWDQNAQNIKFAANGNVGYSLKYGTNYGGKTGIATDGALAASLGNLSNGYGLFENVEEFDIDFLLMGSGSKGRTTTQALANKLISIAEIRKDAVAFISPDKSTFITGSTLNSSADITNNVLDFFAPITSSTYAVFDSGYKYMFDRFGNTFRYIPLNGDIAGTCARNDINNFPWFSPAGTARGAILNAVKLGYNPTQAQRDKLYTNRINPVIFSPGAGIVLFGDKTGFGKASAFDRINVRRLFIFIENAIEAAAKDQLFEFNDEITRTNFVNIVEPFLRDVQAKRGITDFRVVCDETNNTAAVIDNNEFVADIFIKPARSINFIGLTFVATRTGISFEEVIGTV